jgi:hypothetical protein
MVCERLTQARDSLAVLGSRRRERADVPQLPAHQEEPIMVRFRGPHVAAAGLVLALVACGTTAFDIEVGDCFDAPDSEQVATVDTVDCGEPHVYEAFAVFDHPGGDDDPFPGESAIVDYADAECPGPFAEYVGTEYAESVFFITSITPTAETWDDGDREIVWRPRHGGRLAAHRLPAGEQPIGGPGEDAPDGWCRGRV